VNPKFDQIEIRHLALQERLADPSVQASSDYHALAREFKRLGPAVQKVRKRRQALLEIEQAEGLLASTEPDLRALAEEEVGALREQVRVLSQDLEDFLIPRDPRDGRDVIIEIRAGTGGDEAAIFGGDLYRMYSRYARKRVRGGTLRLFPFRPRRVQRNCFRRPGPAPIPGLNLKAGSTAFNAFRTPKPRGASTPPRRPWRFSRKPTRWKCPSTPPTFASTRTGPPAPGANT
jgi:hypothetical protein